MVEVEHLAKSYCQLEAVLDFNLATRTGEILALVGPDGAGKTSIFRAICGLIKINQGQITIAGHDVATEFDRIKPLLGYMPQAFSLYPDLSVEENLYFYAGMFGIKQEKFKVKMEELYGFSGLKPFRERRAGALSGGMKQKLALSCALIHEPMLLVLDEPTTGVDPLSRRQFWEILKHLRESGDTILVSTPYMDEVALADRAIFIYRGKKLAEGTPRELVKMFQGRAYSINCEPTFARMETIGRIKGLQARRFGSSIHAYTGAANAIDDYMDELTNVGIERKQIEQIEPDLEDTFIQLMGK